MSNQIPIIIPEALEAAIVSERLALFIGAGVSMLGGCPSWDDLANKTLRAFKSPAEFELLKELSPRIKLSIACSLVNRKEDIPFSDLLHGHDPELQHEDANLIYASLSKLSNFIVTTNHDKWFDKCNRRPDIAKRDRYYKKEDFNNIEFSSGIIHLHGALDDPQSMILTTGDYIKHYTSRTDEKGVEYNPTLVFLKNLFAIKNVLFIGYSLEEIEILEYVIQKARDENKENNGREHRHFIIQGFFSHQKSLQDDMEKYYAKECGIHLIPFLRDDNDWLQLRQVIEYLAEKYPASPQTSLRSWREMEELLW